MSAWRWLLLFVLATGPVACSSDPGAGDAAAWLERMRAATGQADAADSGAELDRAKSRLRAAARAAPPGSVHEQDARVVRQDIYYRLATMELTDGHPRGAIDWADRGLSLGAREDVFVANLLIARGRAHEALGRAVEAGRDYHRALTITDALLQKRLGSLEGGTP